MATSIDFYSFTVKVDHDWELFSYRENADFAVAMLELKYFTETNSFGLQAEWKAEKGRGFYFWRLRHVTSDLCVSFGGVNKDIFVECAGLACNNLDSRDLLLPLINATAHNATRIDIAVDIETDVDPLDFVAQRTQGKFRNAGQLLSDSGTTAYVGGRTSERMARVYRYAEPHPRAAYLRVESEYKRDAAKMLSGLLADHSLPAVAAKAHEPFGWTHPIWKPEAMTIGDVPYRHGSKDKANTLRWLYGTVIESIVKLKQQNALDVDDWLKTLSERLE